MHQFNKINCHICNGIDKSIIQLHFVSGNILYMLMIHPKKLMLTVCFVSF